MQQKQVELEQWTYAEVVTVSDRTLVIKNLPETKGQKLLVIGWRLDLFVDGLGLKNSQFNIERAQRKGDPNTTRNYSRVVVTTLKYKDAMKLVMKSKSRLKNNEQYKKVYMNMDKPFLERKMENSLRTLINTVAKDKLLLKGGRVVTKENTAN